MFKLRTVAESHMRLPPRKYFLGEGGIFGGCLGVKGLGKSRQYSKQTGELRV